MIWIMCIASFTKRCGDQRPYLINFFRRPLAWMTFFINARQGVLKEMMTGLSIRYEQVARKKRHIQNLLMM